MITNLLTVTILALSSQAWAGDCDSNRCQSYRDEFRLVAKTGNDIYCYFPEKIKATGGKNFQLEATKFEKTITDRTTPGQYFMLLRQWAASFFDGHVNVMPTTRGERVDLLTSEVRFEMLDPAGPNERIIVARRGRTQIPVGATVVTFNGRPVAQAIQIALKTSSGSTERMRRASAAERLVDAIDPSLNLSAVSISVRDVAGLVRGFSIPLGRAKVSPVSNGPEESDGTSTVGSQKIDEGAGYLRIDGFFGKNIRQDLVRALTKLRGSTGLLIDVRNNGGGDQSGDEVLARLINARITRYEQSPRMSDLFLQERPENRGRPLIPGTDFAQFQPLLVTPKADVSFAGKPIVVLTGPDCFSACDTFVSALQSNGIAEVVGQGSGGGTGTPLVFNLPFSGHQFRYSVVRGRNAKRVLIEGAGSVPTTRIVPTAEERVSGEDLQLQAAVEVLLKKIAAKNPKDGLNDAQMKLWAKTSATKLRAQFGIPSERWSAMSPTQKEGWIIRQSMREKQQ